METGPKNKTGITSITLGALFSTVLAFVPNVYDGTFLKSCLLYAFAALLISIIIADWLKKGSVDLRFSSLSAAMLFYVMAGCISIIAAANIGLGLDGILRLLCYLTIFYASALTLNRRTFVTSLLALSAVTIGVALLHFVLPVGSELHQFFRQLSKSSTLGNPSYFAGFLVALIPVLAGQALERSDTRLRRLISLILVIMSMYLLIMIGSRSAWIGFGASILVFGLFSLRSSKLRAAIAGILVAGGLVFILLFQASIIQKIENISAFNGQSTIARRLYIYEGAWRAFAASPVIGNGIGNFIVFLPKFRPPEYWMVKSEDIAPHAHDHILEILSETGVVGLLFFFATVILAIRKIIKGTRSAKAGDRSILIALAAGITGLLADSLFSMNLTTVPVAVLFWMFLGIGAAPLDGTHFRTITIKLPKVARNVRLAPFALVILLVGLMIPRIVGEYISGKELLAGLYLRYEGKKSEAVEKFRRAADQNPHPAEADFYAAGALADREEYKTSLRHVEDILRDYPYYPKVRMIGALSQFSLGDTAAALKSMQEELAIENSPQACSFAAELSRLAGRNEDEYRILSLQLRKNCESGASDHALEAIERIGALSVQLRKEESCGTLLDSLRDKFSDDVQILISLGTAFVELKQADKARLCLIKAREQGKQDMETAREISRLEARIDSVRQ